MVVAPLKLDKIHDLTAGERQALEKLPALVKSGALWACEVAGGLRDSLCAQEVVVDGRLRICCLTAWQFMRFSQCDQ
jgi:hypothetical protein